MVPHVLIIPNNMLLQRNALTITHQARVPPSGGGSFAYARFDLSALLLLWWWLAAVPLPMSFPFSGSLAEWSPLPIAATIGRLAVPLVCGNRLLSAIVLSIYFCLTTRVCCTKIFDQPSSVAPACDHVSLWFVSVPLTSRQFDRTCFSSLCSQQCNAGGVNRSNVLNYHKQSAQLI